MASVDEASAPVWTLSTGEAQVPSIFQDGQMSAERLTELRSVLAALADRPVATLEIHSLPSGLDRRRGIALDAASPLAHHLSQLISRSTAASPAVASATASGENLFRMVVPAKVAAGFSQGLVSPMTSKLAAGGVHSALRDSKGIVGQATFVPVGVSAYGSAGVGAGAGASTGAVAAGGATLTVAAPLILMTVAVGVSAAAEHKRQLAIDNITDLLEQLLDKALDDERNDLDGCCDAIEKANAVLLDEGKLGASLGLDSAVHAIGKAIAAANRRLAGWQEALDDLPDDRGVDIATLTKSFPGIDDQGGTFRAHLELATLAVALKRRVILLQAVEHAQSDPENLFESFVRALKADHQRLDELESGIARVLLRLSALELSRPQSLRAPVFTSREVDRLMLAARHVHAIGKDVAINNSATDVAIEIVRQRDGSVVVLPATPV